MARRARTVQLVKNGVMLFAVNRLPKQDAERLLEPADELIQYLEKCVGEAIPQYDGAQPVQLDLCLDVGAELEREEFVIRTTAKRIELRARTVQAMFHAVYTFLDRFLGVRWLWPGRDGEVTPRHRNLSVPVGTIREKPDFAWRGLDVGGAIYGFEGGQDLNTTLHAIFGLPLSYQKEFALWCRRNRFGGPKVLSGHRVCEFISPEKYGKTHPEYFASRGGVRDCGVHDGKHGNMPCLTNPDVIRLMAQYACSQFEADPELDVCSIALNDGGFACECEQCLAIDEKLGAVSTASIEHVDKITSEIPSARATATQRSITDRLCWNHQQVAKAVVKEFPDRKLLTLLYSNFRRPPVSQTLPESVIGQYCVMGHLFWHSDQRQIELKRLREMHQTVPSLAIYEYYANGAWPDIHRSFPQLVEDSVRGYYNAGVRYFATQPSTGFATNGINYYVLARLLWDRRVSATQAVEDFCRSGFGPAGAAMERFLKAFAERWRKTESGTKLPKVRCSRFAIAGLYSEKFLAARRKDLDTAVARAGGDAKVLARIRFLEKGLEYATLYCRAARQTLEVFKAAGVREGLDRAEPTPAVRAAAQRALYAWTAYWDFVRDNKGTFVFGDFWVMYRPGVDGERDGVLRDIRRLAAVTPAEAAEPAVTLYPELPRFESSGTPRQRGRQVGRRFRELILDGLDTFCAGKLSPARRKHLRTSLAYTKDRCPELITEIEGLAAGVGVDPSRIWHLNAFNTMHAVRGCSALVVADRAGRVLLSHNTDIDAQQRSYYFVHHLRGRGTEALMLQWAGTLWPVCGVNSHGLACCGTSAPTMPDVTSEGLPQHLALYPVLTSCRDVPSAVALLSSVRFTGKGQNIALADAEGRVAVVEKSGARQGMVMGECMSVYRSNHFLTPELRRFNGSRAFGNSANRYGRVTGLLDGAPATDAYALIHEIVSTHGEGGLCQHPETNDGWDTLLAAVVDPHERCMEVCPEKPCRAGFTRMSLEKSKP